jgi:hypothetical protein
MAGNRRGFRRACTLGFGVLVVAALSLQTVTAQADGPAPPTRPSSAGPTPTPRDLYNAGELSSRLQAGHAADFGGAYYGADGALVILATSNAAETSLRSAKASFDHGQAAAVPAERYRIVRHPSSRLDGLQNEAVVQTAGLARAGAALNLIAVDVPSNTLQVGLGVNSAANQAAVLRALGATADEVEFTQAAPVPAVATRFNDAPSWNAGDRIFNTGNAAACTSGFGIHDNQGHHYLITAAHCSATLGSQDFFWNGSAGCGIYPGVCDPDPLNTQLHAMGFSQSVNFTPSGWDTQLIIAPSNDITWTAVSSRSFITASYQPIHNDANQVINEGATSFGWQSGAMTVDKVNACINVDYSGEGGGIQQKCHMWSANQPNTSFCAVKGGDSGGPEVSYSGFGPLAVGENVAGNCRTVYFHNIHDMEAKDPWLIPGPAVNTTTSG